MGKPKTSQKAALRFNKAKRGVNLSRRQIFDAQRKIWEEKQVKVIAEKQAAKRARAEGFQKEQNKKTHKTFDRDVLHFVQEGLTEAIGALGEPVTPLSLFMSAFMALTKSPETHHIPYLLAIASGCVPSLSQGVLLHQSSAVFDLCEQLLAEHTAVNHLIAAKTLVLAQTVLLSVEAPTQAQVRQLQRLEPSKLQQETMLLYLGTFRKFLEQAALTAPAQPQHKDPQTGLFTLTDLQRFYVESVPAFTDACLGNLSDAPSSVAIASAKELCGFFTRTLSPVIVESAEGAQLLDTLLSRQILSVLKPVHQAYWGVGMDIIEAVCNRLNYLKRVRPQIPALSFSRRFPSSTFVLRVLDKIRAMDDPLLNARTERAMVALGKGMSVEEFVGVLPFDPQTAYETELSTMPGDAEGEQRVARLWSTSYTFNVIRRIASHDSLEFLVGYFFPMIQFCSKAAAEAEAAQRVEERTRWLALVTQLWRIAVGFCHYPVHVTDTAFRDLAKRLVGLLSMPLFTNTAATAIHVLCDSYYKLSKEEEQEDDDDLFDDPAAGAGAEEQEARLEDDLREDTTLRRPRHRRQLKETLEEDNYFLSMNDPTWNPHRYHAIPQAYAKAVCAIFTKYSANIMPKLCNTFETHSSTALLLAIQSFSMVCDPGVMTVILKGVLDVSQNIANQAQRKAAATAAGVVVESDDPSGGKTGNAPLTAKRRMILDIACAVVPQLSLEHLTTLLRKIIEPVLEDPSPDSRLLQKKAYKLLYCMFEHRIRDVFPLFREIASSLSVGRFSISISGVKMRVRCLSWALDACKIYYPDELPAFAQTILGEVILFSRGKSSETRELTMDILERMHRYLKGAGVSSSALLGMLMQGLVGQTAGMIASSLVCVAKMVYLAHEELPAEDLVRVMGIGFRLMESTMLEVRTAAAMFTRMALSLAKRSPAVLAAIERNLPKLLLAIATVTSQANVSSSVRLQMRVLLEKVIKRFTYEKIEPIFPLGSKSFLRYTNRMYLRDQRKNAKTLEKHRDEQRNEFNRLFMGLSMNAGQEEAGDDLLEAGALTSFVSKHSVPAFQGFGGGAAILGNDDDDDKHNKKRDGAGTDEFDNMHLDFTQEGKLRIISKEEKKKEDELRARQQLADRLLRRPPLLSQQVLDGGAATSNVRRGKRGREEMEDDENEQLVLRYNSRTTDATVEREMAKLNVKTGGEAGGRRVGPSALQITRLRDQKAERRELKRQRVEEDIRKGDEFKGTGDGDIRRGNLDPFAYVPLNRRYMNRRNARDALHRFEVVHHKPLKGEKARAVSKSIKRKRKGTD